MPLPLDPLEARRETGDGIVRLEFIADKVVIYLMFLAGALGVLENFISGTTTACYVPDEVTSRQGEYINIFCSQFLPNSVYLPYFVVARGVIILAPHYVWVLWYEGYFRYFLQATSKLDVCHDPQTGRLHNSMVRLVKYLEESYRSTCRIKNHSYNICGNLQITYYIKLALQLIFLIASTVLASKPFEIICFDGIVSVSSVHILNCTNSKSSLEYRLLSPVECAAQSFLFTCVPSIVDLFIVVIAIIAVVIQFVHVACLPHAHDSWNGAKDAAKFSFESSLPHRYWVKKGNIRHCCKYHLRPCNDFEFMLLVLDRSSPGYSNLLRNILIQEKIQKLREKCIINLQKNDKQKREGETFNLPFVISSYLPQAVKDDIQAGSQLLIVTVSFGPCTYYTLSSKFKNEDKLPKIVAINFEDHVSNTSSTPVEGTSVVSIQVPADIYQRGNDEVRKFHEMVQRHTSPIGIYYGRLLCIIGPTKGLDIERSRVSSLYHQIIHNSLIPNTRNRVFVSLCPSGLPEYEHPIEFGIEDLQKEKTVAATCGTVPMEWKLIVLEQELPRVLQPLQRHEQPPPRAISISYAPHTTI